MFGILYSIKIRNLIEIELNYSPLNVITDCLKWESLLSENDKKVYLTAFSNDINSESKSFEKYKKMLKKYPSTSFMTNGINESLRRCYHPLYPLLQILNPTLVRYVQHPEFARLYTCSNHQILIPQAIHHI